MGRLIPLIINGSRRFPSYKYRIDAQLILFPKTLNNVTKYFTIAKVLQYFDICNWKWEDIEYVNTYSGEWKSGQ